MNNTELRHELEEHHDGAWGWSLSCCDGDRTAAEDALQTAYCKVLRSETRFSGRSTFRTWLFGVIRMTCLEQRRRNWFTGIFLEKHRERLVSEPAEEIDLGETDEAMRLRELLTRLPERQREVLHLVFYQELTLQEAAEVMGVSVGSVRQHYDRGKRRLKKEYQNELVAT